MNWTFSKKLKQITNILTVIYLLLFCCLCYWIGYVRDEYPTPGYHTFDNLIFVPYILSAVIIVLSVLMPFVKKDKLRIYTNTVRLFVLVPGYAVLCIQLIYYLDIIKTYTSNNIVVLCP